VKKKCLTVIFMLGLLFIFSTVSYAGEGIEDIECLSVIVDDYEIAGEITGEILYNRFLEPTFLMEISEKGYMILYRDTMEFLECGQGLNKYKNNVII